MPFDRINTLLKDKTGLLPKYFSRQLTAFDLTLDLLQKNNQAEVLADSRLTTINGLEASIKLGGHSSLYIKLWWRRWSSSSSKRRSRNKTECASPW